MMIVRAVGTVSRATAGQRWWWWWYCVGRQVKNGEACKEPEGVVTSLSPHMPSSAGCISRSRHLRQASGEGTGRGR